MRRSSAVAFVAVGIALFATRVAAQAGPPAVEIVSPKQDAVIIGTTRLEAVVSSRVPAERVTFFVDGRTICTPRKMPARAGRSTGRPSAWVHAARQHRSVNQFTAAYPTTAHQSRPRMCSGAPARPETPTSHSTLV